MKFEKIFAELNLQKIFTQKKKEKKYEAYNTWKFKKMHMNLNRFLLYTSL